MGVYQQFVPRRATASAPTSASTTRRASKDSLFLRGSYQHRDPNASSSRPATRSRTSASGTRELDTATVVAGWTRIISTTVVNEFRVGYNYDKSAAAEPRTTSAQVNAPARPRERAELHRPIALGFPSLHASRAAPAAAGPRTSTDGGLNADRTIKQNSFSISDNLSWVMGGHSLKARRPLDPQHAPSTAAARGVNGRGPYRFNGATTGQRARATSCSASPRDGGDHVTTRGDTRRPLERLRGLRAGRLEGQQRT